MVLFVYLNVILPRWYFPELWPVEALAMPFKAAVLASSSVRGWSERASEAKSSVGQDKIGKTGQLWSTHGTEIDGLFFA